MHASSKHVYAFACGRHTSDEHQFDAQWDIMEAADEDAVINGWWLVGVHPASTVGMADRGSHIATLLMAWQGGRTGWHTCRSWRGVGCS